MTRMNLTVTPDDIALAECGNRRQCILALAAA